MRLLLALTLAAPTLARAATIRWAGAESVCLESYPLNGKNTLVVEGCGTEPVPEQQLEINAGATRVKLAGKDQCLDAGDAPANGVFLTFAPCDPRRAAQNWWFTDDGRIALLGEGFCVDLPNGNGENLNGVQMWDCSNGNRNQEWTMVQ